MKIPVTVSLLALVLFGTRCGPPGTLIDRQLTEIPLKNMRLKPDARLRVLQGGAIREIPLKAVQVLEIFPEDYVNHDGDVFYSCRLILKSGEKIAPSVQKNRVSNTYIYVGGTLTASGREGTLRISIDNVRKLTVR